MVSQCQTIKKLWAGHESAQTDGQTDGRKDGRTDGQTDRVISIYPLNFVRGGYKNLQYVIPSSEIYILLEVISKQITKKKIISRPGSKSLLSINSNSY